MVNELNLDPRTEVKINNIDVEVLKGDLKEKPWLIESEGENYILLEEAQYDKLLQLLKNTLNENLELKMEQRIMNELPIDIDDVKAVVKQEMNDNNLSLDEALQKVKTNHPNLFNKLDLEELFRGVL